ncbi:formylmethanofuran dehydrogenase subunit E family protein [Synechococcus sp. Nb3U1]|nr:formylmethanofuran dehydrogenase subunit E family protein [Synechococcus sp. Nb3U1]
MGLRALKELDLLSPTPHTSVNRFAVEVIHKSPKEIQFTSIVDGLHAGTGASLGKMNLKLVEVGSVTEMVSLVIHRESGKQVEFRVLGTFLEEYRDLPREELLAAGQRVLRLADEEIFEVTVTP